MLSLRQGDYCTSMHREIASSCLLPLSLLGCSPAPPAAPVASAIVTPAADLRPATVLAVRRVGAPTLGTASGLLAGWLPAESPGSTPRVEVILRTADGALTAMVVPRDPTLHPGAHVAIARATGDLVAAPLETATRR